MKKNPKVVNIEYEPYDVFIGRPSIWGNPFKIGEIYDRETAIKEYAKWIMLQKELLEQLNDLKGKDLGCYCKPKLCHGDILLKLANKS